MSTVIIPTQNSRCSTASSSFYQADVVWGKGARDLGICGACQDIGQKGEGKKTYNTRDSPVVTDPSTSLALTGLSMGERTGSRVLQWVWSYVIDMVRTIPFMPHRLFAFRLWDFSYPFIHPQRKLCKKTNFIQQNLDMEARRMDKCL